MKNKTNLCFGSLLILAGFLFLLSNTGLLPFAINAVVFSWPMLLVLIGLVLLMFRNYLPASVLLLIGAYFLVPRIYFAYGLTLPFDISILKRLFWAVFLIFIGFIIVFTSHDRRWFFYKNTHADVSTDRSGLLNISCCFGDVKRQISENPFKGASVTTLFGGTFLNLEKSELANDEARIHVDSIFGGTEIWVPKSWTVVIRAQAVFGGVSNKSCNSASESDPEKRLIISGTALFGGIEIRRV